MADVSDATFATAVVERSNTVPVVVDLWAPWCGPCKTLGPILEQAVAATNGAVELAKVNVDDNPQTAQAFQVQSIPAVYALRDGKVVDGFIGAQGEAAVAEFVQRLLPTELETELDALVIAGDEASLRQALELDADHEGAVVALADLLVADGRGDEALDLLERIPETAEVRRVAALARTGGGEGNGDIEARLEDLLGRVKADPDARQEFVDLLEIMGTDDPRTSIYRRRLTAQIY
ncbi:MAG: thioredoxin [bacterium]|nr:thioredoxin [bacterium]